MELPDRKPKYKSGEDRKYKNEELTRRNGGRGRMKDRTLYSRLMKSSQRHEEEVTKQKQEKRDKLRTERDTRRWRQPKEKRTCQGSSKEGKMKVEEERLAAHCLTIPKTCTDLKRPICRKEQNARGFTSSASLQRKEPQRKKK
ncbi:uncharacterized protein V6R79_006817 [Siganus canaliculatus]